MYPDVSTAYVEHRRQAEARARREALTRTGSSEVGIAEIYRLFPHRLFQLQRASLPQLIEAEFQAERELCRVNPAVLRQYRDIRSSGTRTGFISDTYWSKAQLTELLRACCPDLQWDFLYASCESGTSKSIDLFKHYLDEQKVEPHRAHHVGDNPKADVQSARAHDIEPIFVPQASPRLAAVLSRETSLAKLLCQSKPSMLDGGMRTLRRLVASEANQSSPAVELGRTILGPVMHAFDAFIADRLRGIVSNGGQTCVAFLGRDGFLSNRIWRQHRDTDARYIEINRRVSMMASAHTLEPLINLVCELPALDADTFASIAKYRSPKIDQYFAQQPGRRAAGKDVAEALPDLIAPREIGNLAAGLRAELMTYLRVQFPDLDTCTDLVVVDLGYSGSIQKALRRVFDIEGIKARIHGLYLLTLDDGFCECPEDDSFEGLISDIIVTPHVKRMLLRNIAVLEQMCCAPTGSVLGYRDGAVLHEDDPQAAKQHALAGDVQQGVLAYVASASKMATQLNLTPFVDLTKAANVAVSTLGRLLLLPTDDELMLLGPLMHDVNLGTTALTPFVDAEILSAFQVTQSLPDACTATAPPMWLAGSFAALSPAQSFLYALFGANMLPSDVFGDVKCGTIDVTFTTRSGASQTASVALYRNGTGELRVRIPMSPSMAVQTVAIPVGQLALQGVINGPFLQTGTTVAKAVRNDTILLLQHPSELSTHAMTMSGGFYQADGDGAVLTIALPAQTAAVAMLCVGIAPVHGQRVLAID
jgi:FMN phosphatase YigB (HAD superfamily)